MIRERYNRIRVALAERGRTNKWLAQKVGKTEMTVSRWVSNKSQPNVETLYEIADALEMEARDLLLSNFELKNKY